jgi:hypothetical protein
MKNCDIYLINLKKDDGRAKCSQNLVNIFNAKIFEGNDINLLDPNGYLREIKSKSEYTNSAKKTKKMLFEHFLNSSDKEYIIVFEDDVYLHNDLFNQTKKEKIFEQLNMFLEKSKPKLLYLGIGRYFVSNIELTDYIKFTSFDEKFPNNIQYCSGAYGFILERDVIKLVLMRINNETLNNLPFDLFCLSYIGKMYPKECFVTNPHIVIPNIEQSNIREGSDQNVVWRILKINKINYKCPTVGILFVKTTGKTYDLFEKIFTCLTPFIKLVYYYNNKPNYDSIGLLFEATTNANTKIKYLSGKLIIESILSNSNSCKYLLLKNMFGDEIMEVTYFYTMLQSSISKSIILDI